MEIKKVFAKYNDDIERLEYKNFQPITNKQYFNQENQKIVFKVDVEDDFIVTNNIQYNTSSEYTVNQEVVPMKKRKILCLLIILCHIYFQI
jgi:hypothetical protein